MRLKIRGDMHLKEKTTINGVYGFWFGHIDVEFPNKKKALIFEPGNYVDVFTQLNELSGEKVLDVEVPHENPILDGTYNITVTLYGPYGNKSILFHKDWNLKMSFTTDISPTVLNSWDENINVQISNRGDVPLILEGVSMELSGTGTVIGWVGPESQTLLIMPNETKTFSGKPIMTGEFKEELSGKTRQIDFLLDIFGASKEYRVTKEISFP